MGGSRILLLLRSRPNRLWVFFCFSFFSWPFFLSRLCGSQEVSLLRIQSTLDSYNLGERRPSPVLFVSIVIVCPGGPSPCGLSIFCWAGWAGLNMWYWAVLHWERLVVLGSVKSVVSTSRAVDAARSNPLRVLSLWLEYALVKKNDASSVFF